MENFKAFGKITKLIPEKIDDTLGNQATKRENDRSRAGSASKEREIDGP